MKKIAIKKLNKGVALLFSILITSILFAIAVGTTTIALNESNFNTSTKKSNEAFFMADTGAECVLFFDKDINNFPISGGSPLQDINCGNYDKRPLDSDGAGNFNFTIPPLGGNGPCSKVSIRKIPDPNGNVDSNGNPITLTTVISKGYNTGDSDCNVPQSGVERELQLDY